MGGKEGHFHRLQYATSKDDAFFFFCHHHWRTQGPATLGPCLGFASDWTLKAYYFSHAVAVNPRGRKAASHMSPRLVKFPGSATVWDGGVATAQCGTATRGTKKMQA